MFFFCSHWSLVDVPLIFFCPADHVPDWQPRVLLGMVEARSVNVKKTTTTTTFKHKTPNAGGISYLFCWHEQVDGIFLSCVYTRREDFCGGVIAAPFTWTSVSACALSDRRYIALLCLYTFSVLLLHRCVLFVFPSSLYHSQRTSTPRVCMSISVLRTKHKTPNAGGISYLFCWHEQVDSMFLSCVYTRRGDVCGGVIAAPFTWTSVSACVLSVDGILLFCVHTHLAFFFYIVAYCLCSRRRCTIHSVRLPHVFACRFLWATGSTE